MAHQIQHQVVRRETDIGQIASPMVCELHAYWTEKRGDRPLPGWTDIDPTEIVRLLPNLIVVGIEHHPLRVRYRLVGTQIVEFRGEVTGHYLDAIPWSAPAAAQKVKESFAMVIASRAPLFAEANITTRSGAVRRMFAGVWPLAPTPEAAIDRCLAVEDYGDMTRADLA